jgi:putative intracellular protease/amidase
VKKTLPILLLVPAALTSLNAFAHGENAHTDEKGNVLVLLSSEDTMQLTNGKTEPTGYYLNEFGVPAKALVEAGYHLVLATPKGNAPSVDKKSVVPQYFGQDEAYMQTIESFVASLDGINDTLSLSEVIDAGLEDYKGVFIPGGHAPLIDLANNPEVGQILEHFHASEKPTAAICHGPIALLSAQDEPQTYNTAMKTQGSADANNWIYADYKMTIFSEAEEEVFESSLENAKLLYYPSDAMATAGGDMKYSKMWTPNVVVDRELITGQNPFSDKLLAEKLIEQLDEQD